MFRYSAVIIVLHIIESDTCSIKSPRGNLGVKEYELVSPLRGTTQQKGGKLFVKSQSNTQLTNRTSRFESFIHGVCHVSCQILMRSNFQCPVIWVDFPTLSITFLLITIKIPSMSTTYISSIVLMPKDCHRKMFKMYEDIKTKRTKYVK